MTGPRDGLDALAGEIDELRRELEGLRNTVNADVDALTRLYDDTEVDGRPLGPLPSLRSDVDDVRGQLHALAEQVSTVLSSADTPPRLPSWTDMTAEQAREAWTRLIDWMQHVLFVRYPPATEVLRDCWFAHPELVENLSWLRVSWALAYRNPKASIGTAAEWHTRWLPAVLQRAREVLKPCYIQHVDDIRVPPERYGGFGPALSDHIRADLARRAHHVESPCPSPSSPPVTSPLAAPSTRTTPPPR